MALSAITAHVQTKLCKANDGHPPPKTSQTIKGKSKLLADYIRRFGHGLLHLCKSEYGVDIIVNAKNVRLEGNSDTDIEDCAKYIKSFIRERRILLPIPADRWPLSKDEIQDITNDGKCVLAVRSMDNSSVSDKHLLRWLDPYGSLEFRLKETGDVVKTDILILLTDSKFDPLCLANDIARFWIPDTVYEVNLGAAYNHKLDETLMNDNIRCKEVWSVVCLHTDQTKIIELINNKVLSQTFNTIYKHAHNMHFSKICVFASLVDAVEKELTITHIVNMLVEATKPLNKSPANRTLVQIQAGKQDINKAHRDIDYEFQRNYRVHEKFPKPNASKGKSIFIKSTLGNIQDAKADVIVNSTTTTLTFKGKCGKDIKDAAGEEIVEECKNRYPNGIPECSVVYTQSYELKSRNVKYIIHTALPKYKMFNEKKVKEVVKKCLYLAEELGCKRIAIPALGVGGLGYPRRETAFYTYEAIKEYGIENPMSNLTQIKIILFAGDEATCKAFANEEFRRRKCSVRPTEPVSNGAPILRRFLEKRPQTCARVMLRQATYHPAYAMEIQFTSGVFSLRIKDATKTPKTWNDSIVLPIQFGTDVRTALAIKLDEERITHLLWNLDTKSQIPPSHQVNKIITSLEEMANSQLLKYLRIVDVVVDEPVFDCLRKELSDWMLTAETEEPNYFLEVIAKSKESLDSTRKIIDSVIYKDLVPPVVVQTSAVSSTASASSTDTSHDYDDTTYKPSLKEAHSSSLKALRPDTEYDPLHETIGEPNDTPTTDNQKHCSTVSFSTSKTEIDDDPTYETIADIGIIAVNSSQANTSSPDSFTKDTIDKRDTTVPVVTDDWSDATPTHNTQLNVSEVSALINPGIVNYLRQQHILQPWIASVQNRYGIEICGNTTEYTVTGKLDHIAKFEAYLEKDFPAFVFVDVNISDEHFSMNETVLIPMNEMQYHYICNLRNNNIILFTVKSMSYISGTLKATGLQNDLHTLKAEIDKFLSVTQWETIVFNETAEASKALENYKNHINDTIVTQKEKTILIIGESANVVKALDKLRPHPETVRVFKIPVSCLTLEVMQGDIRNANAEFIAVSSTPKMTEQKGAGKQIRDMLGDDYVTRCELSIQNNGKIQHGECRVIETSLCVRKWVGNVSVPTCKKDSLNNSKETAVVKAYSNCLAEADQRQCATMTMTCIGSDSNGGFPLEDCVDWLYHALEASTPTHLERILLVEYDEKKVTELIRLITKKSNWIYYSMV